MASRTSMFVGPEDERPWMSVREVVTAMCEMPLDFPKSAVLNTHVSCDFLGLPGG